VPWGRGEQAGIEPSRGKRAKRVCFIIQGVVAFSSFVNGWNARDCVIFGALSETAPKTGLCRRIVPAKTCSLEQIPQFPVLKTSTGRYLGKLVPLEKAPNSRRNAGAKVPENPLNRQKYNPSMTGPSPFAIRCVVKKP